MLPARRSVVILPKSKFGTLDFNLGTSLLVTDATVGAEAEVPGANLDPIQLVGELRHRARGGAGPSLGYLDRRPAAWCRKRHIDLVVGDVSWRVRLRLRRCVAGADAAELARFPTCRRSAGSAGVAVNAPHPASSAVRLTTTKLIPLLAPNFMTPPPGLCVRLRRYERHG